MARLDDGSDNYLSYLLRLWSARDSEGVVVWHASLQATNKQHTDSFADLNALVLFLKAQITALSRDGAGHFQIEAGSRGDGAEMDEGRGTMGNGTAKTRRARRARRATKKI